MLIVSGKCNVCREARATVPVTIPGEVRVNRNGRDVMTRVLYSCKNCSNQPADRLEAWVGAYTHGEDLEAEAKRSGVPAAEAKRFAAEDLRQLQSEL